MKQILLTGGNGFIGRNIKEQLKKQYRILAPSSQELNLLNRESVADFFRKNTIDAVIHSAVYNQKRRDLNAKADLDSNLRMFFHLAEYSDYYEKMIYFGSGAEFDKRFSIQMAKEEDIGRNIPMLNDYALAKYIMNEHARQSKNIYNMRLFGIYGCYENKNCFPTHLCHCALEGKPLTIRQECKFDFLYINDLMEPLCWMLENTPLYHDYNICSGRPVYLSEMAKIVQQISGKSLPVVFLDKGENLEYTAADIRYKIPNITSHFDALSFLYHFYYNEIKSTRVLRKVKGA